jgi:hypothetical protein
MADFIIVLEGRVTKYLDNLRASYPEVWDILKPDRVYQSETVTEKTRITCKEVADSLNRKYGVDL